MTDLDADVKELLIEYLREAEKDRHAKHTMADLFNLIEPMGRRIDAIETWIVKHDRVPASVPPPRPRHRHLESAVDFSDDDPTGVRNLKMELAPIIARNKAMDLVWRVAAALAIVGAAVATMYSAFKGGRP